MRLDRRTPTYTVITRSRSQYRSTIVLNKNTIICIVWLIRKNMVISKIMNPMYSFIRQPSVFFSIGRGSTPNFRLRFNYDIQMIAEWSYHSKSRDLRSNYHYRCFLYFILLVWHIITSSHNRKGIVSWHKTDNAL